MRRGSLYLVAGVALLAVAGVGLHAWSRDDPDPPPPAEIACHAGAYRDANGRLVTLTPSDDGLRYRLESGESGPASRVRPTTAGAGPAAGRTTVRASAAARIGGCEDPTIEFGLAGETPIAATREVFRIRETKFASRGVRLAGRLVLPPGETPLPLAVILHGSEDYSGRLYYPEQYRLPAQGIAVFVYDKRGTGDSQGEYTQDFYLLASRCRGGARRGAADGGVTRRTGRLRRRQPGGVDRAARGEPGPVDFVLVGYGMAEGPLAEDAGEVWQSLIDRGYGADVLDQAKELTDATGRVMASDYREGFDALAAAKAKYREAPSVWRDPGRVHPGLRQAPELGAAHRRAILRPGHELGVRPDADPAAARRAAALGPRGGRSRGAARGDPAPPHRPAARGPADRHRWCSRTPTTASSNSRPATASAVTRATPRATTR